MTFDSTGSATGPNANEAAMQHALLARLLDDEAHGEVHPVAHYVALFPEHADLVERTFAELGGRDVATFAGRERIGPFVLVRELGRGGQGTVFLARDSRLPRFVALKVLALDRRGPTRTERFRREAEVASRIDHPSICSVLESGDNDGVLWIAMRNVPGETLAMHIARAAAADGGTGRLLLPTTQAGHSSTRAPRSHDSIVSLCERIARALHVAHEAGIVHRDVKPGNVMVTPEGDPVLLDFGLARDVDETGPALTHTGDAFGTPAYMAPEQLRRGPRPIDRRADVYALGVTLFECLTLRRPFGNAGLVELAETIERSDVPDPRSLEPGLAADLAVVVRTAMARLPEHRYATALDFADDLRAVREHEPIRARPPGPFGRSCRWVRRNRIVVASMLAIVVSLSGALWWSLAANAQVLSEREKALVEVAHREEIHEFMAWVLNSPSPLVMGPDTPMRVVLERAAGEIGQRFEQRTGTRGEVLVMLATAQLGLGRYREAKALFGEAIPLLRAAGASYQLGLALTGLARAAKDADEPLPPLEPLWREAVAIFDRDPGPQHDKTLAMRWRFAAFLGASGRDDEALAVLADLATRVRSDTAAAVRMQMHAIGSYLHADAGRWDEAFAAGKAALAVPCTPGNAEHDFLRLELQQRQLQVAARLGRAVEAVDVGASAIVEARRLMGARHPALVGRLATHGTLLRMAGRHADAETPYREALELARETLASGDRTIVVCASNLGALYRYLQRPEDALRYLEEARTLLLDTGHGEDPTMPGVLDNLADLHLDAGRFDQALAAQARSLELLRAQRGDAHFETVCAFHRTARLQVLCAKIDDAKATWELGIAGSHQLGKGGRVSVLRFANEVALTLLQAKQAAMAVPIARDSLAQANEVAPADPGALARFHSDLGVCLQQAPDLDGAAAELAKARALLAGMAKPPPDVAEKLARRIAVFEQASGRTLPK